MEEHEGARTAIQASMAVPKREYVTDAGRRVRVVGLRDGFVTLLSLAFNHEVDVPPTFDLYEIGEVAPPTPATAPTSPARLHAVVRSAARRSSTHAGAITYPEHSEVHSTDGLRAVIVHTLSVAGALDAEEIHARVAAVFPGVKSLDSRIRTLLAVSLSRAGVVVRVGGRYTIASSDH